MEIERKFLVLNKDILNFEKYEKKEIVQKYVSLDPVVRIRNVDNEKYYLTVKSNGGLEREEIEIELFKDQFIELEKKSIYNEIKKTRYYIPLENNLMAELDIYHYNGNSKLKDLMTVEVEFETVQESKYFIGPIWFGEEITENQYYKNHNLCK